MINARLGGIRKPKFPPAARHPSDSSSAYLFFLISGKAAAATVVAVEIGSPDTAANPAQAVVVAIANPPR